MTSPSTKRGEPFFAILTTASLLIVLAGFSPSFFLRDDGQAPLAPAFLWHGIILSSWYLLAVIQSLLIGVGFSARRLRLHKTLGIASLLLAIAVLVSGIQVALQFYDHGASTQILSKQGLLTANLMNLVSFAICFAAGMVMRKRRDLHKRFLSLAGIVMIGPAAFRLVVIAGLPPPASLIIQFGLLALLAIYDRRRLHRISKATWSGFLLIILMIGVTLAVG